MSDEKSHRIGDGPFLALNPKVLSNIITANYTTISNAL